MKTTSLEFDFAVAGGGLAGLCAALAAARNGLRT
ncbi:MAG: FAD-binding protein, partial [Betaproteobacteria bacterium]|nr:FAD-binding protein [Betaproteobacteria bacterium]